MGILQLDLHQDRKKVLPKKPKQTVPERDQELFSDYGLHTSWEEALWEATVPNQSLNTPEQTMMEEENPFSSVWDINVDVSGDSAAPSEACVVAENNNEPEVYSFPKEIDENVDDCWGHGTFHAPAALVEGISLNEDKKNIHIGVNNNVIDENDAEVSAIYNLDIVKFALGESGLDGFLGQDTIHDTSMVIDDAKDEFFSMPDLLTIQPIATTANFIHTTETFITIDPTAISLNFPNLQSNPEVAKKSKLVVKRSVGRPERQTPLEITEVPKKGSISLTVDQMRSLKYRRMRDLNNEASKKCRKNRKQKLNIKDQEYQELEEKNRLLTEHKLAMELEVEAWRARCRAFGYCM